MLVEYGLCLALGCAALAILYGIVSARGLTAQPAGNERDATDRRGDPGRRPAPTSTGST
jgi:hypothetical protein